MADDFIRVEGLAEFRKGLRDASRDLPKVLTRAHKQVAVVVAASARPKMRTKHGRVPRSAATVKASGTQSGAFVRLSGPTAFGDEFGGGRRRTTRQFRPWLGKAGYAVYPTIREKGPLIMAMYTTTVLGELERKAFPG